MFELVLGSPCSQEKNLLKLCIPSVDEVPVHWELWLNQRDGGVSLRNSSDFIIDVINLLDHLCVKNLHECNLNWFVC